MENYIYLTLLLCGR